MEEKPHILIVSIINLVVFFLSASVTTAPKDAKLRRSKPCKTVKRNFQHFSELAFLFDLYESDIYLFTMAIPGPNVALSFINALGVNDKNGKTHLFADDTVLYSTAPSVAQEVQN